MEGGNGKVHSVGKVEGSEGVISSADEFLRLYRSSNPEHYRRAVFDEAPENVWMDVVHFHPEERVGVVRNKTIPLAVLEVLVDDPDPRVRYAVAMKRKLTPPLLDRLARDVDEGVRMMVALHKNSSKETLESLICDPWCEIRAAVQNRLRG